MKVTNKIIYKNLDKIFEVVPRIGIGENRFVIFSDLHMGDGSSNDDFISNSGLFKDALNYYLQKDYFLALNGDVEELYSFSLSRILLQWKSIYDVFDKFAKKDRLLRNIGSSDRILTTYPDIPFDYKIGEGFRLEWKDQDIFIFHGSQGSERYNKYNDLIGFVRKYYAKPLGIKNISVSHSSTKQYKVEKKLYHYSSKRNIISIIGYTHRPLFQSENKFDRLKLKIENLVQEYAEDQKGEIESYIQGYKKEITKYYRENIESNQQTQNIYNTIFNVPCLFNTGTVIGKRGLTCIELDNEKIKLVHWFDKRISKKYLKNTGYLPELLPNSNFYRMIVNEMPINLAFAKIKLLG